MKIDRDFKFVFLSFIGWRAILFIIALIAFYSEAVTHLFPPQLNFLGGGLKNYLSSPLSWAWANFDGEHYLSLAQNGYGFGEQAFFPLYPLLIKIIGGFFGGGLPALNLSGQLVSNLSFFLALVGLYKLVRLDYSEKIATLTIILLLIFPTSFYFAGVYTESLFLALVIWSFYFARKGKWFLASVLGGLASGTRVIGIILLPVLFVEWYKEKKRKTKDLLSLLIIPLGLIIYMYYLKQTSGDWLAFLHTLPSFGEQRSGNPILLPQVFYRYFVKIIPSLSYSYFPVVFTTFLEILTGLLFLFLSIIGFFRLRISYALFLALGYLIPTLSGSFSSLPRYVLVLFPAFILISLWLSKTPKLIQISVFVILFILLGLSLSLFSRGYFIS